MLGDFLRQIEWFSDTATCDVCRLYTCRPAIAPTGRGPRFKTRTKRRRHQGPRKGFLRFGR